MNYLCIFVNWIYLYLRIIRVFSSSLIFYLVYESSKIHFERPFLLSLSAFFIVSSGYVYNDYKDIQQDIISAPSKIIPSGRLSPQKAFFLSFVLLILGIFILLILNSFSRLIFGLYLALALFLYSNYIKKILIIKNVFVSLNISILVFFGNANNYWPKGNLVFVAVVLFLFMLQREILMDIHDRHGDAACFIKTVPVIYGFSVSLFLIFAINICMVATILGYLIHNHISISNNILLLSIVFYSLCVLIALFMRSRFTIRLCIEFSKLVMFVNIYIFSKNNFFL